MEAELIPLFEKPKATHERVALANIKPWSTGGAKSANTKSIAALGLRGEITLKRLAPGSRYHFEVIDGSRRLNTARDKGLELSKVLVEQASVRPYRSRVEKRSLVGSREQKEFLAARDRLYQSGFLTI